MYFTSGGDRAFESLMQGKPGFDHYDSGDAGAPEDCGDCRFYRPDWKYQFCVYAECPYQPGKLTALDAVLFQVKGVDDEMAVFRVEKNRGYTVMSNHHLRNKDLSLKAKGLLSQMLSLPENWDYNMEYVPWSAYCNNYQLSDNGIKHPTRFQAVWHYPDGDFIYFDGIISEIIYG